MSDFLDRGRMSGRIAAIGGLVFASGFVATAAFAGSCPADKVKADVRAPVTFAAVGVTAPRSVTAWMPRCPAAWAGWHC